MSYLDKTGLQYFWSKISGKLATKEQLQAVARSSTYTSTIPVTGWSSTAPYYVDIVVAPILIGGKDTATLIDGTSLFSPEELPQLGALKLLECSVLENSYLRLRYQVIS